ARRRGAAGLDGLHADGTATVTGDLELARWTFCADVDLEPAAVELRRLTRRPCRASPPRARRRIARTRRPTSSATATTASRSTPRRPWPRPPTTSSGSLVAPADGVDARSVRGGVRPGAVIPPGGRSRITGADGDPGRCTRSTHPRSTPRGGAARAHRLLRRALVARPP